MSNMERVDYLDFTYQCVLYILDYSRTNLPLRMTDIRRYISDYAGGKAPTEAIIRDTFKFFREVYGYEMNSVDENNRKRYILKTTCRSFLPYSHQEILSSALMFILFCGGSVIEDRMWEYLGRRNPIDWQDVENRKLLTQRFTLKMYLKYEKVYNTEALDGYYFIFKWGPRTKLEISQDGMLKIIIEYLEDELNKTSDPREVVMLSSILDLVLERLDTFYKLWNPASFEIPKQYLLKKALKELLDEFSIR